MSSFDKALEEGTVLKQLLASDDHERQFRAAMRNKEPKLITYFLLPNVLEDLVRVFVDEEERSLQEASEVLGIVLANIDEVTSAIVENHLPLFFSYLDREVMNPRRLYYFLRVASFLFQNRTLELFSFAQSSDTFTLKLVRHLSSVHIMQLVLNMLKLEDQMREMGVSGCTWSKNSNLVGHLVRVLQASPATNLESISKLISEICAMNSITSELVKSLLLAEEGALTKTLVELSKLKAVSTEAMRFLDEVILRVIMANQDDPAFFEKVSSYLQGQNDFAVTLQSNCLSEVLVSIKFMYALIKHKALFLLGDGLAGSLDLFSRFPWSNILHNVIMEMFVHVLHEGEETLINQLVRDDILLVLINGLVTDDPVGYLPHLRNIASALAESPSDLVRDYLVAYPLWEAYVSAMEFRNDKNLTFREAERLVVASLKKFLGKEDLAGEEAEAVINEEGGEAVTEGEKATSGEEKTAGEEVEQEQQEEKATDEAEATDKEANEEAKETTDKEATKEAKEEEATESNATREATTEAKNEASPLINRDANEEAEPKDKEPTDEAKEEAKEEEEVTKAEAEEGESSAPAKSGELQLEEQSNEKEQGEPEKQLNEGV